MNHYEIVKKITGPINPIGVTETDTERFENLKDTLDLIYILVGEIKFIASKAGAQEHSINKAGTYAKEFLIAIKNDINL